MNQQREVLKKQKETADKIASRTFAQSYLADLVPSVFGTLSDNGYFYDPVERGMPKFIHQLYNATENLAVHLPRNIIITFVSRC